MHMRFIEKLRAVFEDREQYGSFPERMDYMADVFRAYMDAKPDSSKNIDGFDIGVFWILTKIIRLAAKRDEDNVIDIAGYARGLHEWLRSCDGQK